MKKTIARLLVFAFILLGLPVPMQAAPGVPDRVHKHLLDIIHHWRVGDIPPCGGIVVKSEEQGGLIISHPKFEVPTPAGATVLGIPSHDHSPDSNVDPSCMKLAYEDPTQQWDVPTTPTKRIHSASAKAESCVMDETLVAQVINPGGGGGSPGGSNTQIQYNNSSVFGGDSGFTTNGAGIETITAGSNAVPVTIKGHGATCTADLLDVNQTGTTKVFSIATVANAVNGITVTSSATGVITKIGATGSDTNVGLCVSSKAAGVLHLSSPSGNVCIFSCGGTAVMSLEDSCNLGVHVHRSGHTLCVNSVTTNIGGTTTNICSKTHLNSGVFFVSRFVGCGNAVLGAADYTIRIGTGTLDRAVITPNKACLVNGQQWQAIKTCACASGFTPTAGTCVTLTGTTTKITTRGKRAVFTVCCATNGIVSVGEYLKRSSVRIIKAVRVRMPCGKGWQ